MKNQGRYIIYAFLSLLAAGILLRFIRFLPSETSNNYSKQSPLSIPDRAADLSPMAKQGKTLFMKGCASCHMIFKDMTGPSLFGFTERGPWTNRQNVYDWIRNPAAFMQRNQYAKNLKEKFGSMMTGFPDLSENEIDAICEFIKQTNPVNYSLPVAVK